MSHTLAYIDMRIACCKEDGHDHIGFRLEDFENIRAHIAALEAEKSDMLKAMQDARRALAYAQKYDTVMEISYLKLDAAICAVKPAKEG